MSKYNTISNFLFNNTTPVLLPVHWVHNYHAEIYFILLHFYTSYVWHFCPASNNHELTVHDNCTMF